MAREVDFENPSNDDLIYLQSRSWLIEEAQLLGVEGLQDKVDAFARGEVEEEETDEDGDDKTYAEATVEELKAELKSRGLETSGKKDELIARLEADDEEEED